MAKKRKGKGIWVSPAKPDDPIYQEGLTIFTPKSARSKPTVEPPVKSPPKED